MESLYKKANVELYEIIRNLTKEEQSKIPEIFIRNLKSNIDEEYIFKYDKSKAISEQNLMNETKALLIQMYIKYIAPESEQEFWKKYNTVCLNEIEERRKKEYKLNDIFKKKTSNNEKIITENTNKLPVEIKNENIFKRLFNYIKRFFYIK